METGSSVLVDQSRPFSKKCGPSIHGFNGGSSRGGGFPLRSPSHPQLLHVQGACGGLGFLGPHPPPPYASRPLPSQIYASLPPPGLLQRPRPSLLPLPLSKPSSLPSPAASTGRMANKGQRKPRSPPAKRKGDAHPGTTRARKETLAAATLAANSETPQEEDLVGDVYSLSPPPSSLPMPRFCMRERWPPSSSSPPCSALALGGDVQPFGGGVDAGASDDLRRLLRL
uniref:Uncharacterized protein n=1 Tax=Anthurium amnicola TaxID=1678845 RepID=A0A1D1YI98_9ARAE